MKHEPLLPPVHGPSEAEVQKLAYHLWIDGGCLEGVERDNWFAAKELLRHRHGHVRGHAQRGMHADTPGIWKAAS